ncbi:MAG: PHP domain-containing protein [Cyanobacteriota bacterium]|nr:PHP domain-containing protein [Cyanobacteriota bacterium]
MTTLNRHNHPLAEVLRHVNPGSCPGRFNFHCHTDCSDGSLTPLQLAEQALELGLKHLAVTDHHSLEAYKPIAERFHQLRAEGIETPTFWRGVEISCVLEGCLVHVLALGFEDDHWSLDPYLRGRAQVGHALRADAVVSAIHAAGGLALLAHPGRYRLPFSRLIRAAAEMGFDGGEAWYDYEMKIRWKPSYPLCESIASELLARGLLLSCGTDTHGSALSSR